MKAAEIMTREVVAVTPDTSINDVATTMIDHRISAVPVVDRGKLVGIVTENDLLRRVELATERRRPRWLHFLTSDDTLLAEYLKAHGQTARYVMTPNVITVRPDTPIAEIADIVESRHIKRVPVVDGDRIVGIVSRANLVQALATYTPPSRASTEVDDSKIRESLCAEMGKIGWGPEPIMNNITVSEGIVHLWGFVVSEGERKAVLVAARGVAGVKEVRDHRTDLLPTSATS